MTVPLDTPKVIAKAPAKYTNLDWEQMRTKGRDYLGEVGGKIWTDHNVHDPGITMLEVLCYALMDLGYRTNLPIADILAQKDASSKDNDFFTAADILTCNPVTILDYRKLLIDTEGVRNAWVESAEQPHQTVKDAKYLGLYNVYIETENEDTRPEANADLLDRIRHTLTAHRNLCEDFVNIYLLCKTKLGMRASIELEKDSDIDEVYPQLVGRLKEFMTPQPRFYTLQQLLDKGTPIEDIFAGRPGNLAESHGFLDTHELTELNRRQYLRLSDAYHILLDIPGVRNVKKLEWSKSEGTVNSSWTFMLDLNHTIEFSLNLCAFEFTRQGVPIPFDRELQQAMLDPAQQSYAKVSYRSPSPYLEPDFPVGNYREDLAEYQSLQHDLPRVYGLGEGGLPQNAPDKRVAQVLQLKGYLLFFDVLLSGYLAQLQNLRPLLSFNSSGTDEQKHSYFSNNLSSVPDIDKLVRFTDNTTLCHPDEVLANPVPRAAIEKYIAETTHTQRHCDPIAGTYYFDTDCDAEVAIQTWHLDLQFGHIDPLIFKTGANCWRYCFRTNNADVVLLSQDQYKDEKGALQAFEFARYAGQYHQNFFAFKSGHDQYTFSLSMRVTDYARQLQQLLEQGGDYAERRSQFLDHLLSRFAEKFSDFALLSFKTLTESKLKTAEITYKEKFMQQYPDLSSNRGRAYDYQRDGWNNDNLSGVEKRVMALGGMGDIARKYLCNFVVEQDDKPYFIKINWSADLNDGDVPGEILTVPKKYYSRDSAAKALGELKKALASQSGFTTSEQAPYRIKIAFHPTQPDGVAYSEVKETWQKAEQAMAELKRLIATVPFEDPVKAVRQQYRPQILNHERQVVATSKKVFESTSDFRKFLDNTPTFFDDASAWTRKKDYPENANLLISKDKETVINWTAFECTQDRSASALSKWTYRLLDKAASFRLTGESPFSSYQSEALPAAQALLHKIAQLQLDARCDFDPETQTDFALSLDSSHSNRRAIATENSVVLASTDEKDENDARSELSNIERAIRMNSYKVHVLEEDCAWRFTFTVLPDSEIKSKVPSEFTSKIEYTDKDEAANKAKTFYENVATAQLSEQNQSVTLTSGKVTVNSRPIEDADERAALKKRVSEYLKQKDKVISDTLITDDELAIKYIQQGDGGPQKMFRLVDKGNLHAVYVGPAEQTPEITRFAVIEKAHTHIVTELVLGDGCLFSDENKRHERYCYKIIQRKAKANVVLFHSTTWYASKAEASEAFSEQLLTVMDYACDKKNYGPRQPISLEPIVYDSNDLLDQSRPLVYVPEETREAFNPWYDHLTVDALVIVAKQYPIRFSTKEEDEFYKLFPCEEDKRDKTSTACGIPRRGKRYYYFAVSDAGGLAQWQGNRYYERNVQAAEALRFFNVLLQYDGNYITQSDYCSAADTKRIYLREVLAEGRASGDGWQDVEKFIKVSQREGSLHPYQRELDCSHSFNIYCRPMVHPTGYKSAALRDEGLEALYAAFEGFADRKLPSLAGNKPKWTLNDSSGMPLAEITVTPNPGKKYNDLTLPEVFNLIGSNLAGFNVNSGIEIRDENKYIKVEAPKTYNDPAKWFEKLFGEEALYPIVQIDDESYRLRINLPGFGLEPTQHDKKYRLCNEGAPAWVSACAFRSIPDAEALLRKVAGALADKSFYARTYDCECGPHRIELGPPREWPNVSATQDAVNDVFIHSAVNPQHYPTSRDNCDAIVRAKRLINSEGVHLLEHILLLPYRNSLNGLVSLATCKEPRIYTKNQLLQPDGTADNDSKPAINFKPGRDGYSFIATAFLPAWPERFCTLDNRAIVENLLYREIPAHILLRIKWLSPKTFFTFETNFKEWQHALGRGIASKGSAQNAIELAKSIGEDTSDNAEVEIPCGCGKSATTPPPACGDRPFTEQIDEVFCWGSSKEVIPDLQDDSTPPPENVIEIADMPARVSVYREPTSTLPDKKLPRKRGQLVNQIRMVIQKEFANLPARSPIHRSVEKMTTNIHNADTDIEWDKAFEDVAPILDIPVHDRNLPKVTIAHAMACIAFSILAKALTIEGGVVHLHKDVARTFKNVRRMHDDFAKQSPARDRKKLIEKWQHDIKQISVLTAQELKAIGKLLSGK